MNRAVAIDYLRRKWWLFLLAGVLHFGLTLIGWTVPGKNGGDFMVLGAVAGGSAFLLLFEMMRGSGAIPRTLLSLPMTAKELARTWRFVGLEFPALFFLGVLSLSSLASWLFGGGERFPLEHFLLAALVQTALLGVIFFALTGMPATQFPASPQEWVNQIFFGLLFGLSIPCSMFLVKWLPREWSDVSPAHVLVAVALVSATVAGWFRADILVQNRVARSRRVGSTSRHDSVETQLQRMTMWTKPGGIPFLLLHFGRQVGLMGLLILSFNWAFMAILMGMQNSPRGENAYQGYSQTETFAPIMVLILVMQVLTQIRALRSLPFSRAALTSLVIYGTAGFGILFWLVATAIHSIWAQTQPDWTKLLSVISSVVILLFSVPVFLRFGFRLVSFIILPILMMGIQMGVILNLAKISQPTMMLIYGVTIVIGGVTVWALTYFVLGTNYPWREGALKMPFQQRRI